MQQESYLKCPCEMCGANIEFPTQAVGQSIPCPHCAQNTKLFQLTGPTSLAQRRRLRPTQLVVLICALLGTALAFGIFAAKKSSRTVEVAKPIPQAQVEAKIETDDPAPKNKRRTKANTKPGTEPSAPAKDWNGLKSGVITLEKTENSRLIYAVGIVRNPTRHQRFGVKVELDLFDEQETKIGSATDYVQVIEPGKEWNFKALVTDPKTVRAELTAIKEN